MAKQNECRDEFSNMQPLEVPVHKFSYFMICIAQEFVNHSFLSDTDGAVLLHFVPVMQIHILIMPRIFLVMF